MVDPDHPCPHENFGANVSVNRLTSSEEPGAPVTAFIADITVWCEDCTEPFRWIGTEAGVRPDRPMCSVDERKLHAPIRPASADPDFGLGIPGFAVRWRESVLRSADAAAVLDDDIDDRI